MTFTLILSLCQEEEKQSQDRLVVEDMATKSYLWQASIILSGHCLHLWRTRKSKQNIEYTSQAFVLMIY